MSRGIEQHTKDEIRNTIRDIYGQDQLDTAFITGSIAAGLDRDDSDIDIFLCHSDEVERPEAKKAEFVDYYFDLHERLGRDPDPISPGEVLSFTELETAVSRILQVRPSRTLFEKDDFDAICWAGMLVGRREMLIEDSATLTPIQKASRKVVYAWASELDPSIVLTDAAGLYTDPDKVLRRTVSSPGYYDAH